MQPVTRDELDAKLGSVFAGKVVRKDLLHQIKGGENVPSYVLEYLLGQVLRLGRSRRRSGSASRPSRRRCTTNYFRHDEANKAQSHGRAAGHAPLHRPRRGALPAQREQVLGLDGQLRLQPRSTSPTSSTAATSGCSRAASGRSSMWSSSPPKRARRAARSTSPTSSRSSSPGSTSRSTARADASSRRDEWIDVLLRSVGPRAATHGAAAEDAPAHAPHPLRREELQLHRARPARHRQVLCLQRDVALLHPASPAARRARPTCSTTTPGGRSVWSATGTSWPSTRSAA